MRISHRHGKRKALTLLEVVTALAIFMGGVSALYQLIQNASYRAIRVDWKAQASLRCQSKMAELTVGVQALESTDMQQFEDDEAWQWRTQVDEEFAGLYRVYVEVQRELPNGEVIKSDLTQMLLPPTMRGSSLDVASTPGATTTTPPATKSSSDMSTGSTGSTTGTGATGATAPAAPMTTTPAAPMGGGMKR